jgi:metallo-beta-lactamase class B
MKRLLVAPLLSLLPLLSAHAAPPVPDDLRPIPCGNCADWVKPQAPFNIYGNTWYVGTAGLSSVLITSPHGHILIDGTLPQAAQQIEANIQALGFRLSDVKLIVNSHPHSDHAGGIAYLQRRSRARVAAGAAAVPVLESGRAAADDPQYASLKDFRMPKIAHVRGVHDGEALRVGPLRLVAHLTPGHTDGGATWSWTSCEKAGGKEQCRDIVFADSLNANGDPDFRYSGDPRNPNVTAALRASIAKMAALPCDIVISAHPAATDVLEKAAAKTAGHNTFIEAGGCRAYADEAQKKLDDRLAQERAAKK